MNPHFKNVLIILRDSVGLALLLTLFFQMANGGRPGFLKVFVETLIYAGIMMFLADGVFQRLWPVVEQHAPDAQGTLFVVTLIAIGGAGSVLGSVVLAGLRMEPGASFQSLLYASFKVCVLVALVIGVNEASYERLRGQLQEAQLKLRTEELERERAMKLATEARLGALEARLHPHFLFNTLNSISSLIPVDPERAERQVERMAALLRFTLDSHQSGLVAWDQEMKIVRDYLEIEQIRLGQRLRFQVETVGDLEGLRLPPLSVQTLVENSIKHAVAPAREGGEIRVHAERNSAGLRIRVSDTGQGFTLDVAPAGHGLDNLRDRLAGLFGNSAELRVDRWEGWNIVSLQVPA